MRQIIYPFLLLVLSLSMCSIVFAHSFDLNRQEVISLENIIVDLTQVDIVFIGESHDQAAHHRAQLQLIEALHQSGSEVSIGLEMIRQDGQTDLDNWVEGKIDEADFARIFGQHWSGWYLYRDIFVYAREKNIPLIGLNISRKIINQVARNGFNSLSEEQRATVPIASCNVSADYRKFIRRALGGHNDNDTDFENFCEAQLLWDASMAKKLRDYLDQHPRRTLVVLAGNGHSWKHGIPEQLIRFGDYRSRVLLPEVRGHTDLSTVDADDADYLLQGVEQAPLH